jgi:hypothetical protein
MHQPAIAAMPSNSDKLKKITLALGQGNGSRSLNRRFI